MNEMYDDPVLVEAFDQYAQEYNAHYDRPYALELASVTAGMRVLDAGCGPGLHAFALQQKGASVVGIDSSEHMLERARRRLGTDAELVHASVADELPFRDASFDLVMCASVINYMPDATPLLREFARVLTPDGAAVVSTRHPMTDWVRKGGSYFDVRLESDEFAVDGLGRWHEQFWRQPLSRLCQAVFRAGLLIEQLSEPLPSEVMARDRPAHYRFLQERPTFVILRLVRSAPRGGGQA